MAGMQASTQAGAATDRGPPRPTLERAHGQVSQVPEVPDGQFTRIQQNTMDAALMTLNNLQAVLEMSRDILDAGRDIFRHQQNMMLEATVSMIRARAEPARLGRQALDTIALKAANISMPQPGRIPRTPGRMPYTDGSERR